VQPVEPAEPVQPVEPAEPVQPLPTEPDFPALIFGGDLLTKLRELINENASYTQEQINNILQRVTLELFE